MLFEDFEQSDFAELICFGSPETGSPETGVSGSGFPKWFEPKGGCPERVPGQVS